MLSFDKLSTKAQTIESLDQSLWKFLRVCSKWDINMEMVRNKGKNIMSSQRMLRCIGLGPTKQELKLSPFLSNLYEVEA